MTSTRSALDADWLGVCRRAVGGLAEILSTADHRRTSDRDGHARQRRRSDAGDRPQRRERRARTARPRCDDEGYRFTALSEERGAIDYGDQAVKVIIDPIDGSLNAKRGIPHHALSIAVADGPTMADVAFAFVYDFGPREEWYARRGEGSLWVDGVRSIRTLEERRGRDGRIEVLGIESADPRWVAASIDELVVNRVPPAGARHDRPRCARSPRRVSTGCCRSAARAASTPPPAS